MAKRHANPRVTEAVKEAVASILETEIADPRLRLVTVSDVEVTHDLSRAVVYYTTLDPGLVAGDPHRSGGEVPAGPDDVVAGLDSASARIRVLLGQRVRMRSTPELVFEPDPVAASAQRVETLLRRVREDDGRP